MFKGKVMIYKTDPKTGRVYQVEKEFDNPKEYEEFLSQHSEFGIMNDFSDFIPRLSLGEWTVLEKWIEDILQRRFGLGYGYKQSNYYARNGNNSEDLPVDLSRYELEIKKLEEKKKKQKERMKKLEDALNRLKNYRKQFEESGRTDLLKQIDEDIKKVERELKLLKEDGHNRKNKK